MASFGGCRKGREAGPASLILLPRNTQDPVTTSDGHTYERREIFRWLCTHNTSPLTGAPLPNKALTPAIALRQLIATFLAENPHLAP